MSKNYTSLQYTKMSYEINAAVLFNKMWRFKCLAPRDIRIKVNGNNAHSIQQTCKIN